MEPLSLKNTFEVTLNLRNKKGKLFYCVSGILHVLSFNSDKNALNFNLNIL